MTSLLPCFQMLLLLAIIVLPSSIQAQLKATLPHRYDVVVYGGTSGGVIAAVQAANMGKLVVLVEPGRHVGGLTSGGLGATDIGNKGAIGGLSRNFYRRLGTYYQQDKAWTHERRQDFPKGRRGGNENEMWRFEPRVAEAVYRQMLAEANVPVLFQQRLRLKDGVTKSGTTIVAIQTEKGLTLQGKVFIDATYEGDLMARAGVSYHVGREANKTYGETLNGVQTRNAVHHQFIKKVDPYRVPGDPDSGLLPGVSPHSPGNDGDGDHRVQAYCFRLCTTDVPENQIPWKKPAHYDPLRYELLLRNFEAGDHRVPWHPTRMPNRKTDTNNNFAISTDNIGMNYDYPDGDYETRERIFLEHLTYQQGLMWTLANHARVPAEVRKHFQTWQPARDEFTESNGWPHQLYIREARRMISDYVTTQHNCQGSRVADDSVGLAAYTMDSHNIQRYVKDGAAHNEGDVQVGGFPPYAISYRSIRPRKTECTNLLVPVCLSASHIAYGSIRMEPVFMALGQSAATAAAFAIDQQTAVQNIDIKKLQARLIADNQILKWTGPKPRSAINSRALSGVVVDNLDAELVGNWIHSRSVGRFVDSGYIHDGNLHKGKMFVTFRPTIKKGGRYEVRLFYTPASNRATNVRVTVESGDGTQSFTINQQTLPGKNAFRSLGTFRFDLGRSGSIRISNEGTQKHVVADAVQLLPVEKPSSNPTRTIEYSNGKRSAVSDQP